MSKNELGDEKKMQTEGNPTKSFGAGVQGSQLGSCQGLEDNGSGLTSRSDS